MFDQLFPETTETAFNAKLLRQVEPQPTGRFSTWELMKSPVRGGLAGTAQAIGSTADMLGAFGQVMGATDARSGGMFSLQTDQEKTQTSKAVDELLKNGPDYNTEVGRSFRTVAKDYMPDPVTSHWSEQAVANLFRMGSKALASAATLGNVPGAIVAGAEEGFTMASDLADQGVDLSTRTKVGAVNAAVNAVGFALPAAGKTWLQTGALALAGGPASFVAQNLATREILQRADYSKQADQFDPFDPVGLALSTVIPLGFGALAMRGAKAKGGSPDMPKVADDLADSARVALLRENIDAKNPAPANLGAADAHVTAYARAIDQMSSGHRVQVEDLIPPDVFGPARMLDIQIEDLQAKRTELTAKSGDLADPGAIRQVREELDALLSARPDDSDAGLRAIAKDIQATDGISYKQALSKARGVLDGIVSDYDAKVQRLEGFIESNAKSQQATDQLNILNREIERLQAERARLDAPDLRQNPVAAAASEAAGQQPRPATTFGVANSMTDWIRQVDSAMEEMRVEIARLTPKSPDSQSPDMGGRPAKPDASQRATPADPSAPRQPDAAGQTSDTASAPVDKVLHDLEVRNPTALDAEIPIEFDQNGKATKTVTARQFLEDMQREVDADVKDAGLIEVAATCFLSSQ